MDFNKPVKSSNAISGIIGVLLLFAFLWSTVNTCSESPTPPSQPAKTVVKQVDSQMNEKERETKTIEILAKLKKIPVSQYALNKHLYQQLVNYNPENEKYSAKLKYYSQRLKEQIAEKREKDRIEKAKIKKEIEVREAKFGKPPLQSSWDGSYLPVKQYLKRIANDPDSIKIDGCTQVYFTKSGWLVGCDSRGRNAFGGMIRQSNWFTIVHDRVIQMHDASAYKP